MARSLLAGAAAAAILALLGCSADDEYYNVSLTEADICAVTDGQNEPRNLTDNPGDDCCPSWAPDAARIAFATDRDVNWEVYLMDADGGNQTNLSDAPCDDWEPAWSPAGDRIAFVSDRDGSPDIYLINSDGTGVQRLTAEPGADWEPAWSPDGAKLAFSTDRDGDFEIYVLDVPAAESSAGARPAQNGDYPQATQLTENDTDDGHPEWSPSGDNIAYLSSDRGGRLYKIAADGTGNTLRADTGWTDTTISWSADAALIAYARDSGLYWPEIYVLSPAGNSRLSAITRSTQYAYTDPDWAPDGDTLLVTRWKRSRQKL